MTSFLPADFEVLNLKFGGKQLARDYVAVGGARARMAGQFRTHAHKYSNFAHVAAQMPDNKRIQAPEETYCPLLFLAEDEKQSNKLLVG